MKRFATLLLLSGLVYLSSCGDGSNTPLPVAPSADTVSKGSLVQFTYTNDSGLISSFSINDLTIHNVAYYTLTATDVYNATDSLWHLKVEVADLKRMQIAFMVELVNTSSTGIFTVNNNNSSFIDYTHGENNIYSVYAGSSIDITQSSYPIKGTMSLTLYKNHVTSTATGNFVIYY